jgi:hypothetical protein
MSDPIMSGAAPLIDWIQAIPWSGVFALAGIYLGHRWSTDQRRESIVAEQKYSDQTRFYNHKLEAYSRFLGAAMQTRIKVELYRFASEDDQLYNRFKSEHLSSIEEFSEALGAIHLLATKEVAMAAIELWSYVTSLPEHPEITKEESNSREASLTHDVRQLMREELAIDAE